MNRITEDNYCHQKDQIQLFSKLVFENTADYSFLISIAKKVGINALFHCPVYSNSDDETEIREFDLGEASFLFIALFYENLDVIRILLENGADPNGRDFSEEPAIWELQYEYENSEYGLQAAKLLLEHGADPNIEWEGQGFYYYVNTKPLDLISCKKEFDYLMSLCSLLEEYGGELPPFPDDETEGLV